MTSESAEAGPNGSSRRGVLVVDDDSSLRQTLEEALRPQYQVWTSPDAEQAQRILDRTRTIHGILLDVRLPGMSGLQFGKRLRSLLPRLKVFLMTGVDHSLVAKEGAKIGASAFLSKPFPLDTLRLMLASHLISCDDRT
jgi:two-component system response regulator AtoC